MQALSTHTKIDVAQSYLVLTPWALSLLHFHPFLLGILHPTPF